MESIVIREAARAGRQAAAEVLEQRVAALEVRAAAVAAAFEPFTDVAPAPIMAEDVGLLAGVGSAGQIIAEGDSWFDYPGADIIQLLEDNHGFDVESVAHKGDTVEDMAYSGGQLLDFTRRLEKLLRYGRVPRAILVSGGGNDIAGSEFRVLLDHRSSKCGCGWDSNFRGATGKHPRHEGLA